MAFDPAPRSFFGPEFTVDIAGCIQIGTVDRETITPSLVGEVVAAPVDNVLELLNPHYLKVDDPVLFDTSDITGITAYQKYYVLEIPTPNSFTIAAAPGGPVVALSGGATPPYYVFSGGLLQGLTLTEADPVSGDWRQFIKEFMKELYRRWTLTPVADRPRKLVITRAVGVDASSLETVITYSVRVIHSPGPLEIAPEP